MHAILAEPMPPGAVCGGSPLCGQIDGGVARRAATSALVAALLPLCTVGGNSSATRAGTSAEHGGGDEAARATSSARALPCANGEGIIWP